MKALICCRCTRDVSTAAARARTRSSLAPCLSSGTKPRSARRPATGWRAKVHLRGSSPPDHRASLGSVRGATTVHSWPSDQAIETVAGGPGFITEMHVIRLCGYSLNRPAHPRVRRLQLHRKNGPLRCDATAIRNRDGILQLGNINSDKSFSISPHGSSYCDEDRLGKPANLERAV